MRGACLASSLGLLLALPMGCANGPLALKSQNETLQQQQLAMQQRTHELQSKASTLDKDNQELESLLAQQRQQNKVLDDQLVAMRDQLSGVTNQLAQLRDEKQLTEKQAEALMASQRRRIGAKITANNSLAQNLPTLNLPGIEVRADGDVVRIEMPAARIFQPNSTILQPMAGPLLDNVAAELVRAFPEQTIGIEGHTDDTHVRGSRGGDNQQLSVQRATAVYQQLLSRGHIPASRLFIVGHGSNHPVVSNATAAGKARNNRVELVVYPEKAVASR